ncbi:MAG: PAS domain-containing sensor histidine kinase, partial [Desulfobacula sp.]|nr:PAS domain-containing sensor histidine kinase [Desulfobacula sp.]
MKLFVKTLKLIESGDEEGLNPVEFEMQQFCKDGSVIWTSNNARILSDSQKQPVSILGITHDITEHKKAEEDIKKSQRKLQNIMESMTDGLTICDGDGRITFMNTSGLKQIGYTLKEVVGRTPTDLFIVKTDSPKFIEDLKTIFSGKILTDQHYGVKRKNGELFPASVNLSALYDNKGRPISIIAIHRDITSQKRAEHEKRDAQKIAAQKEKYALVGQIAGKMAHDFNNVLAVIMGNAQLSLLDCKEEKIIKTLELIFNQTIRGKNLTKNLVVFAKDQEPKQEFFRLNEKIDLVFNLLTQDLHGIELLKEDKPGVPDLLADPGMIEHALVNLI